MCVCVCVLIEYTYRCNCRVHTRVACLPTYVFQVPVLISKFNHNFKLWSAFHGKCAKFLFGKKKGGGGTRR